MLTDKITSLALLRGRQSGAPSQPHANAFGRIAQLSRPVAKAEDAYEMRAIRAEKPTYAERDIIETRPIYETRQTYGSRDIFEERDVFETRDTFEMRDVFEDRELYEARVIYEDRPIFETRDVFETREVFETRNLYETRAVYEQRAVYETSLGGTRDLSPYAKTTSAGIDNGADFSVKVGDGANATVKFVSTKKISVTVNGTTKEFSFSDKNGDFRNGLVNALNSISGLSANFDSNGRLQLKTSNAQSLTIADTPNGLLDLSKSPLAELGLTEGTTNARIIDYEQVEVGIEDVLVGTENVLVGTEQFKIGTEDVQVGTEQIVVGTENVVVGTQQVKVGTEQFRTGTEEIKIGTEQVRIGTESFVAGSTRVVVGQERVKIGTERYATGSKSVIVGIERVKRTLTNAPELSTMGWMNSHATVGSGILQPHPLVPLQAARSSYAEALFSVVPANDKAKEQGFWGSRDRHVGGTDKNDLMLKPMALRADNAPSAKPSFGKESNSR